MRRYLLACALSIACLVPYASGAHAAAFDCLSCHGQKGAPGFVDTVLYGKSVHGKFTCTDCHLGIVAYPHGKVAKVNCGICHFTGNRGAPTPEARAYELSVHGKAVREGMSGAPRCQTCHGSHYIFPSSDERSRTNRLNIPALCSTCHPRECDVYRTSIHGRELLEKKNSAAATCFDCHLEHRIPNVENPRWKLALIKECGTCHAEQLDSYQKTYHGQVTELGYTTIAKCVDCHGYHNILPPPDKGSTLSREHILATCRKCHPKATLGFTEFYAHPEETNRAKYPVLFYTYLFMTILLIGVFSFFFTHTILWAFRTLKERTRQRKEK
jgi:hypothetical protein